MNEYPGEIGVYQDAIENNIFNVRLNLAVYSRAFIDFEHFGRTIEGN